MSTIRLERLENPNTSDGGIDIDSSGKVGIGTTTPGSLLELSTDATSAAGGITVDNTNAAGYSTLQLKNSGASGKTYTVSVGGNTSGLADKFYIYDDTAAATRFVINSSGNVGIGTTSIDELFHIEGSGTNPRLKIESTGADSYPGVRLTNDARTYDIQINGANDGLRVYDSTAASERLVIDSSGRVGIGTNAPTNDLDILKTASGSTTTARIGATAGSGANNATLILNNGGTGDATLRFDYETATNQASISAGASNQELKFNTGGTLRMRIHPTGYLNAGGYTGSNTRHRLNGINALQGTLITTISGYQPSGGTNSDTAEFFSVIYPGISPSTAATAMKVYRNSGTTRSISANGTINASGNDYAEYMLKAGDFAIAKGDVCGVNAEGKLTNVFADAISFVVKSTDPSYVGGDTWHLNVGEAPGGYDDDRTEEEIAAAKIVYEQELEAARQMVDRIAFCGQVPVNVTGTTPGQYIVPAETADGGIEGVAKNEADLTLAEYMRAVGKVIAIEDDGRARIIVKVA